MSKKLMFSYMVLIMFNCVSMNMLMFFSDGNSLVLYTMGWIIFVVSVIESFMGYMLVWGNMSYWGASVMINILAMVPFIGNVLVKFIWCSSFVVLNFAITIHFLVGLIIIALIIMHILYLHSVSSSSPFMNSNSSLMMPFFPMFFKDLFVIILLFLFCSYNFFLEVEAIYGNVQNLIVASPTATPTHILPEWYFLLFYSVLSAVPSKVLGAVLVLVFFISIIFCNSPKCLKTTTYTNMCNSLKCLSKRLKGLLKIFVVLFFLVFAVWVCSCCDSFNMDIILKLVYSFFFDSNQQELQFQLAGLNDSWGGMGDSECSACTDSAVDAAENERTTSNSSLVSEDTAEESEDMLAKEYGTVMFSSVMLYMVLSIAIAAMCS